MVLLFLTSETDSLKEMQPQQLLHLLLLPLMLEPQEVAQLPKPANTTPAQAHALEPNLKSPSANPRKKQLSTNAKTVLSP